MTRMSWINLSWVLGMFAVGCAEKPQPVERIDADTWRSPHTGFVQSPASIAVVQGTMPLAYVVREAGIVRVVDDKTKAEVARVEVQAGQLVAVEERGVVVGKEMVSRGLPADHAFTIFLDIASVNAVRPMDAKDKK